MPGEPEPRGHLALVHDAAARERRVLLVQAQDPAREPLVLQRLAQDPGAVHGLAVVGEAERAGVGELGHLGQRLAVEAARDRGHEADRDAGLAPGRLAQRAQDRRGVDDRVGVRHRDDRDVAAGGGGAGAGVEVLLVLLARRAQVHVRVDEAREQMAALAVEDLGAVRRLEACRARRSRRSRRRGRARRAARRCPRAGRARARRGRAGRRGGCSRWSSAAHAPAPTVIAAAVRRGPARQQLVEHRHPDDDAGRDLLADHGLRGVDHLGGELDAAVDRARVHEHLAGAEPAAVDLVLRRVLAQARHEASRSSARAASAARRRRRPRSRSSSV